MATAYNPSIVTNGLAFCLDASNRKSISSLGCEGFSGALQLIRNLVSSSDTITSLNGLKLGNVNFFTIFAIDYPEGSFGGSAAGRQGITPGYNVTSGSKVFDFGRALNYAVWNKDTETWVKTSIYDSYVGTAAVDTFVSEYTTATQTYPRAIHVVAGSHRDGNHTTAQYNILKDLGAPSNVDSIINTSDPEWILVGEPGLGAGNAYGWAFQNYTTDSTRVAHLNLGLPIYGTKNNYLSFDGTDDRIVVTGAPTANYMTLSCWFRTKTQQDNKYLVAFSKTLTGANGFDLTFQNTQIGTYIAVTGANSGGNLYTTNYYDNKWHNLVTTYDGSSCKTYFDGVLVATRSGMSGNIDIEATKKLTIGCWPAEMGHAICDIAQVSIYTRALTAAEVTQNYNSLRNRFVGEGSLINPFNSPTEAQTLGYSAGTYYFKSGNMAAAQLLEFQPNYYENKPFCCVFRSPYRAAATTNKLNLNIPMGGLLVQRDTLDLRAAVYWSVPITYNTVGGSGNNTADSGNSSRRVILGSGGGHGIYNTAQSQCNWSLATGAIGAGWDGSTCGSFPNDLVWGTGRSDTATYENRSGIWSHWITWS